MRLGYVVLQQIINKKCKYGICILVLLKFIAFTLAVRVDNQSSCNCIRLKDCTTYTTLLRQQEGNQLSIILDLIRKEGCGFEDYDIKICCPTTTEPPPQSTTPKYEEKQKHDVWIWDRWPSSSSSPSTNRFAYADDTNLENLVDYKDKKTELNAPHVFYEINNRNERHHDENHYHYQYHIRHGPAHENSYHERNFAAEHTLIFPDDVRLKNRLLQTTKLHFTDEEPKKTMEIVRHAPLVFPDDDRLQPRNSLPLDKTETDTTIALNNVTNNTTTTTADSLRGFLNSPGCGVTVKMMDVTQEQFPWITRIAYINTSSQRISYRCSGSVISDLYILTAAHCVTDLVNELKLSHVRISDTSSTEPTLTYGISDVIIHPNYDQPKYANDIALLKIIKPLNAPVNLTTICLPLNNVASNADRLIGCTGVVAGWSNANEAGNATVKFLRLPIVNNTNCAITYAKYTENFQVPIVITPAHLCAQSTNAMHDVCQGDSGGPFMDDGTSGLINKNGRYTLLGIVAFGPTVCEGTGIPGVYMRVSSFIDWIISNLQYNIV